MSLQTHNDSRVWQDSPGAGPRPEPARQDSTGHPEPGRGREADSPTQIPPRGWWDVIMRTKAEAKTDNVPLLAAGIAFFALLALVPALVAVVSIYGLAADPAAIARHVGDLLGAAPGEVRDLVETQLRAINEGERSQAGIGVVVGIVLALWSASSGTKHAIEAVNAAYDEAETRGLLRLRLLALVLTLGAVLFFVVAIVLIAVLPAALDQTSLAEPVRTALNVIRWPLLAFAVLTALAVFYRYAPDRDQPRWRWVSPGAVVASLLWLAGSAAFSFYAANFARYNETYGSLGAVVVVMLWLFLTAYAVLLGAELNAELERQTRKDSTAGAPRPLGQRSAYAADTVGETAAEVRARRDQTGSDEVRGGNSEPTSAAHSTKATERQEGDDQGIDLRAR